MAEAAFRASSARNPSYSFLIDTVDSAGTAAYHVGEPPDYRTMSTLKKHNITEYEHSARQVTMDDFRRFDFILAMDRYNLRDLLRLREDAVAPGARGDTAGGPRRTRNSSKTATGPIASAATATPTPAQKIAEVRLFGDFGADGKPHERVGGGEEVQDPYYGGRDGFEEVYQQAVNFSNRFFEYLGQLGPGKSDGIRPDVES
jgi:low molecular weight phosphotyrosine protein phosphatase